MFGHLNLSYWGSFYLGMKYAYVLKVLMHTNIKWKAKILAGLYCWPGSSAVLAKGYFSGTSESIHEGVTHL